MGDEKARFEAFIDFVIARLNRHPDLHIYHYAPYEPTALKRLMGRHGTREAEVDRLLREGVLVDLYRAVRQGVRASVESYSIKKVEGLYGFARSVPLRSAIESRQQIADVPGRRRRGPDGPATTLEGNRGLQPRRLPVGVPAASVAGSSSGRSSSG